MSKRMEGKQNTPSVIARLMGLDELPPQQPLHRQQVLSDDYLRKTASIGILEKRSVNGGRLSKISAEKKDKHFCSSEMSKIDKQIIWSVSEEKANHSKVRADFSFSRQRNSPSKYLSKDRKLFHLKGLDDALEDACVIRDNLPRYCHHPDLSIKKFADPKDLQPQVPSGWFSASTSTSISDDSESEVCKKLDKMISQRTALRSLQKLGNSCGQTHNDPLDEVKSELDLKDGSKNFSRRIVVLKPNSRQAQNCARNLCMSKSRMLLQSDSDYMDHGEFLKPENGELNAEVPETADATSTLAPPRQSFRVTRGATKQTAQVVKEKTDSSFGGVPRSRVKADESSPNVSERISCQSSFDCKRRDRILYPFPSGSLFAMEAKKKIFERWKTTKNFREVEVDGRRCTLGEMFVMHDGEARPKTKDVKFENFVSSSQFSTEGEKSKLVSPLCIGSKCSSKDKHIRNLPRLEPFKRSSVATRSSNPTAIGDASQNDSCLGHVDTAIEKYNNLEKASTKEDSSEPRDPGSSCEKQKYDAGNAEMSHNHALCSGSEGSPVLVTQVIRDDLEFGWDKKDIHREAEHSSITVANFPTEGLASINASAYTKPESVVSFEDRQLELSPRMFVIEDGHTSSDVWGDMTQQRSSCNFAVGEPNSRCITDLNLGLKLKEINQPSPDSVLEPPFKEENPFASEFSNSHLADLTGLAMKLELLDSKSDETNSVCSGMNVSSDEDSEKGSGSVPQYNKKELGMFNPEESRDFSYLIDVLDEAGLCDRNLDNLYETWHSMEFPDPHLFEALEKKYGKQTSWLKSDRRLLFDRINSGLKEIMNSFLDIQISAMPLRRRFCPTLRRDEIEEELWMLLLNQEKEVSKDLSEKALGREVKWLDLEEDISIICREIEEFLFNELAAELVEIE